MMARIIPCRFILVAAQPRARNAGMPNGQVAAALDGLAILA